MAEGVPGGDDAAAAPRPPCATYDVCFDLGHCFRLFDRPETFHVSQAGLALGDHLVRHLRERELGGRILEIGTGSGAISLLLRGLGASSISATDISAAAVSTARQNELANFGDAVIDFRHSDLFPDSPRRFDLIVFNPPGWRTPSDVFKAELDEKHRSLDLAAMFYGDSVLLRFLHQLPEHLAPGGRAIIGLNSLVGIADIFGRSRSIQRPSGTATVHSEVLERIEFPLLFYTEEWLELRTSLLAQFEQGREEYAATFITRGNTLHWFYEITEVTVLAPFEELALPSPLPTPARAVLQHSAGAEPLVG
ncbi:methyltransferase [Actinoplanes sp. NPDC051859]|uniref:methyltransferase n=1 Tax=Actinoplanes sp. NPDC051859 TaxID=3363909 RepID=UPI0037BCFC33